MKNSLPISLKPTLPFFLQNEWDSLELAHQSAPPTSIRLNPKKPIEEFPNSEQIPWSQYGRYLAERPSFTFDPLFHAGAYYVQEASSMFLEYAVKQFIDFNHSQNVLDLCAAPGGKSTHIASLLSEDSLLISNEIIGSRATILNENICKWGYDNTWVSNADPSHFKRTTSFFNLMLVDAPCSGSGLFRKIPYYAQDFNLDLVLHCAQRQKRILADAWDALAYNGFLVYMTCSMSEAENEQILDFISNEFDVESCKISVPPHFHIFETQSEKSKAYGYRLSPHLLKGEGFFLAIFQKKSTGIPPIFDIKKKQKQSSKYYKQFTQKNNRIEINEHDNYFLIYENHLRNYEYLKSKIKLIKKGIHIGKLGSKEMIPSHEIALYEGMDNYNSICNVDKETAILYLKKENFKVELNKTGWFLMKYQDLPIGWIKNIGNIINNYYPVNYRILSSKNLLSNE